MWAEWLGFNSVRSTDFYPCCVVHTGLGILPAYNPVGTEGSFHENKAVGA